VKDLPALGSLTSEQYRQKLAGFVDPAERLELTDRESVRLAAIDFVSCLPQIFGDDLDRMTLWDRIGSGIQVAFAKTADADVEFFISEVCRHIQAGTEAARCEDLSTVLFRVAAWEAERRTAWIQYLNSHLPIILVHARANWEVRKAEKKGGGV
jgi:hypothetical protein